jgi:hypothetical protein
MQDDDRVQANLHGMDDLDFTGWNHADWQGVFAHHHTDDVLVDWKGQPLTHGIQEHIDAMKAYVDSAGGTPPPITYHPIAFGSGEWTCVIGEFEGVAAWSPSPNGAGAPSRKSTSGPDARRAAPGLNVACPPRPGREF